MSDQKIKIDGSKHITVALICPDIPQNTGNIARLCMATGSRLVLVRPLGFRLTDSNLQRAGMDYWKALNPLILNDVEEFVEWIEDKRCFFLSAHADKNYASVEFKADDVLVFGSESAGLPDNLLSFAQTKKQLLTLPMIDKARCINLSSTASAVVYEALKQIYLW